MSDGDGRFASLPPLPASQSARTNAPAPPSDLHAPTTTPGLGPAAAPASFGNAATVRSAVDTTPGLGATAPSPALGNAAAVRAAATPTAGAAVGPGATAPPAGTGMVGVAVAGRRGKRLRRAGSPASARPEREVTFFEDIELFERLEWEKTLFDRTGTSPLWSGKIPLGDYGYIAVDFTARWRANSAALAGLGPGVLRHIWVDLDPDAARAEGHAELFIPADVGIRVLLGGSVEGHSAYLDVVPLLTLEGGLAGMGTASILGAIMVPVSITYEREVLSFVVNPKVGFGVLFTFDLDAWAAAAIFRRQLTRKLWHVVDWRWGRAWQLGVRMKVEYKDGKFSPIEVDFNPLEPLPIEDIMPQALGPMLLTGPDSPQTSPLAQAEQGLMAQAGSVVVAFPIPSKWTGPTGPEPDCTPAGMTVDGIKPIAVPKKPPALKKGEYSGNNRYKNLSSPRLPDDTPSGQKITYLEYDRDPYDGVKRNTRRFIVGSDGTHFATDDHYASFWRFR